MGKYVIKFETYLRLAAQIAAYIAAGIAQYCSTDNEVAKTITFVCALVVTAWNFWKNNSFTQAALQADELMKEIKTGTISAKKVEE